MTRRLSLTHAPRRVACLGVALALVAGSTTVTAATGASPDKTPPYLKHAVRGKRAFNPKTGWNMWSVKLVGGDVGSGLHQVQFWFSMYNRPIKKPVGGAPGFVTAFGPEVGVPSKYPPVWVRASDNAGNWSRWYQVK